MENVNSEAALISTPWTGYLCREAKKFVPLKGLIVDLGSGDSAPVSQYLFDIDNSLEIIAIDPYLTTKITRSFKMIKGYLKDLHPEKASLILFNPPSTPTHLLNPDEHQFNGGVDGNNILMNVILDLNKYLDINGSALVLCPTYFPIPKNPKLRSTVLSVYYENIRSKINRTPAQNKQELFNWIKNNLKKNEQDWSLLSVKGYSESLGVVVMRFTA